MYSVHCTLYSGPCTVSPQGNRKIIVLWRKVFGNKTLNFFTEKSCGKKISGNKSYHFGTLSGSSMILYKKPSFNGKCMGLKDVYNHGKRGLLLKTPLATFNIEMHKRKFLFRKTSQSWFHFPKTWDFFSCIFSSRLFFLFILFPETLLAALTLF